MTVTNNYNLQLPLVGGDVSTWGTELNNNMITPVDSALGGNQAVTVTSADVTLTTTQFQNAIFTVSGTLTGNRNLFVPISPNSSTAACGGKFVVVNNSSGAFTLTVKSTLSASTGVTVPQGGQSHLFSDGTNVKYADAGIPGYATAVSSNPNGQLAGTAGSVNTNPSLAWDYVNNVLYACTTTGSSATAAWSQSGATVLRGFDTAINLQLNASVNSNILTVAVKAANTGADPTTANPVTVYFPDSTVANGDPVAVSITSALSVSTVVGATLASQNNVSFRLWIVIFNNGGTPVLALWHSGSGASTPTINGLDEAGTASATQMSSTATSAGTFYCPNGTTISGKSFRIIGYLTYETALATAGTYNNAPDVLRLFGPGVKKPADPLRIIYAKTSTPTTISSTSNTATSLSASITTASKANLVDVVADGAAAATVNSSAFSVFQIFRSSATAIGNTSPLGNPNALVVTNAGWSATIHCRELDFPQSSASVLYGLYGRNNISGTSGNAATWLSTYAGTNNGVLTLTEIMG